MAYPNLPWWMYLLDAIFGGEDKPRRPRPPKPRLGTRIRHRLGLSAPDEPKDFEW